MAEPMSITELLDDVRMSVASYLRDHDYVTDVDFIARSGASVRAVEKWEASHPMYPLPQDVKTFYLVSDGLKLTWSIATTAAGRTSPLGNMQVNPLSDLNQVGLSDDERYGRFANYKPFDGTAFDIDSSCPNGTVGLVYLRGKSTPQVWFRDMACSWHFIANSFTDYFRLMMMHLGLPSWQYAFTDTGLDPMAKQWFRLLCPERLAIDQSRRQVRPGPDDGSPRPSKLGGSPTRRRRKKLNLAAIDAEAGVKPSRRRKAPSRPHGKSTGRPSSSSRGGSTGADATGSAGGTSSGGAGPGAGAGTSSGASRAGGSSSAYAAGLGSSTRPPPGAFR